MKKTTSGKATRQRKLAAYLPLFCLLSAILPRVSAAQAPAASAAQTPELTWLPPEYAEEYHATRNLTFSSTCGLLDRLVEAPSTIRLVGEARAQQAACALPLIGIGAAEAEAALAGKDFTFSLTGNVLTIFARSTAPKVDMYGTIWGPLTRIATGLWAARFRLVQPERSLISLTMETLPLVSYRGAAAPPAPRMTAVRGTVSEVLIHSRALEETRKVQIYVPPGDWTKCRLPVLVLADGLQYQQLVEAMIEDRKIRPIMLVGLPSGQKGIVEDRSSLEVDIRGADYIPDYPGAGQRFKQHMDFVANELPAYIAAHYPSAPVGSGWAVTGYSNGGVFAFWAGVLHPELFGTAIPMSAGAFRPGQQFQATPTKARFLASAGLYEPPFLNATRAAVEALTKVGYAANMTEFVAGHSQDQWQVALAQVLPKIFLPAPVCHPHGSAGR